MILRSILILLSLSFASLSHAATASSISQFGVTFRFDRDYTYGQFANGDYWVLGPVTITKIEPDASGGQHGWQVNPQVGETHAWDSRATTGYDATLTPKLPYRSSNSESIVKVVSGDKSGHSYIQRAVCLTVVPSIPPANGAAVFRPPYVGTSKPQYKVADLRTDLLPRYARVGTPQTLEALKTRFSQGLRMNHHIRNSRQTRPVLAMDDYQPANNRDINDAMLRLMLDDDLEIKLPALIAYTQHTIDRAHIVLGGYRVGGTGHDPMHRTIAAWAAVMLDLTTLKTVLQDPNTIFHADRWVQKPGAVALWGEDNSESAYWGYIVNDTGSRSTKDPYGYIDGGRLSADGSASYQIITSQSLKGEVLVGKLFPQIGTQGWSAKQWPIMVEYATRWVEVGIWASPDPAAPADSNWTNYGLTFGPKSSGGFIAGAGRFKQFHGASKDGGQYKSAFAAAMWNAYMKQAPATPPAGPSSLSGTPAN